jgi:hypothetical protein
MSRSSNTSHDAVSPARDGAEQAIVAKLRQRDAHARLAELVALAELGLRDLASGRDHAADDVAMDALVGAVGEQGNGDAHRVKF